MNEDESRKVLTDGECIIVPAGNHVQLVCCDCALVHDIWPSYDADKRMVSIMVVRNDIKTKPLRTKKKRRKEGVFSKRR